MHSCNDNSPCSLLLNQLCKWGDGLGSMLQQVQNEFLYRLHDITAGGRGFISFFAGGSKMFCTPLVQYVFRLSKIILRLLTYGTQPLAGDFLDFTQNMGQLPGVSSGKVILLVICCLKISYGKYFRTQESFDLYILILFLYDIRP